MKRIFILGAGSSIGHTDGNYPGISNIFAFAKEKKITVANEKSSLPRKIYRPLYQYVIDHYGKSILSKNASIDIEELLSYLEIEIERKSDGELIEIRKSIKEIIRSVLIEQSKYYGKKEVNTIYLMNSLKSRTV